MLIRISCGSRARVRDDVVWRTRGTREGDGATFSNSLPISRLHAFYPQKCSYVICVQSSPNLSHLTIWRYQNIMSEQHQRRGLLIKRKRLETKNPPNLHRNGSHFYRYRTESCISSSHLGVVHRFLFVARH